MAETRAHCLILGQTLSGKSTCGQQLVQIYRANNINTILLDPTNDPKWQVDFRTTDPDEFLRVFWDSERCAAFIDEAGETVGRFDDTMIKTGTRGRHHGHRVHYLSQRGVQIARTVRDQCTELFLFQTNPDDCKIHAKEWCEPELAKGHELPRFHYYYKSRFQPVKLLKLEKS